MPQFLPADNSSVCESSISSITIYVLTVVFVATLIRSVFGFEEALIGVPLLAFCIPLRIAAPLAVLVSITISGIVVVQDWRKIINAVRAGWCSPRFLVFRWVFCF